MAGLPKVGEKAPEFTLEDQSGREVRLSDFRGRQHVILYFYPKDDTPGCTKEACSFRDNLKWFEDLDTQILGVSVDSVESHQDFVDKYNIPFPLLSDHDKKVSQDYGVLNDKGYASRVSFLIDKQGIIREVYPEVKVDGHWEEVKKSLESLAARK